MCLRSNVTTKAEWKSVREAGGRDGWRSGKVHGILERKKFWRSQTPTKPAENQVPGVDDGSAPLLSPSSSPS